jgi:hypothetical protein
VDLDEVTGVFFIGSKGSGKEDSVLIIKEAFGMKAFCYT